MRCVWEHNGSDTLLYCMDYVGAYTRGESLEAAMAKMEAEMAAYCSWSGREYEPGSKIEIVQEQESSLQIADADSDILLNCERAPLTRQEYDTLKALVLKSAKDFYALYASVPHKNKSCLPPRTTFYGNVPITAQQMYDHTKNVNAYYFSEINIAADNEGSIYDCRKRGLALVEQSAGFLNNEVTEGSYGELWSLRKVMRRFLWHDRIHARAMYRMAVKTFGALGADNPFGFPVQSANDHLSGR